jgi:hypothetical protein
MPSSLSLELLTPHHREIDHLQTISASFTSLKLAINFDPKFCADRMRPQFPRRRVLVFVERPHAGDALRAIVIFRKIKGTVAHVEISSRD